MNHIHAKTASSMVTLSLGVDLNDVSEYMCAKCLRKKMGRERGTATVMLLDGRLFYPPKVPGIPLGVYFDQARRNLILCSPYHNLDVYDWTHPMRHASELLRPSPWCIVIMLCYFSPPIMLTSHSPAICTLHIHGRIISVGGREARPGDG